MEEITKIKEMEDKNPAATINEEEDTESEINENRCLDITCLVFLNILFIVMIL